VHWEASFGATNFRNVSIIDVYVRIVVSGNLRDSIQLRNLARSALASVLRTVSPIRLEMSAEANLPDVVRFVFVLPGVPGGFCSGEAIQRSGCSACGRGDLSSDEGMPAGNSNDRCIRAFSFCCLSLVSLILCAIECLRRSE